MQDSLIDRIFSVTELTTILSNTLEEMFYGLRVEGEVCNFRPSSTKHWYFSIKDKKGSMLNCTCFASMNWRLRAPQNGDVVVVTGSLSYWAKGASLSFNCTDIKRKGEGDLRAEIEKRRAYYRSLGWFEETEKKKLPEDINTIGIVTADTGAVIHDIMRVSRRRAPGVDLILFPSKVQGEGAAEEIASRIRQANNFMCCDVLIVGRGGGSEEDLAPYSSCEVIEAIHESMIPVISAVGHDSDFPLSDFVADVRASTPSAAAEIATQRKMESSERLMRLEQTINLEMRKRLYAASQRLSNAKCDSSVIRAKLVHAKSVIKESGDLERIMKRRLEDSWRTLDWAKENMSGSIMKKKEQTGRIVREAEREINALMLKKSEKAKREIEILVSESSHAALKKVAEARTKVSVMSAEIKALSPTDVLKRGYSIVTDEKGKVIRSAARAKDGMKINVKVKTGSFGAVVSKEE